MNNTLCFGRKGRILAHIEVTGVESHAGNDFSSGRNAIAEMAHKILELQSLTDLEKDTTVTCSIIKGGSVNNAVPGHCYLEVECRYKTLEEMERFKKGVADICAKSHIEGTSSKFYYSTEFAPYETTEQVMSFFRFIENTARECGLEEVKGTYLGGSSDASYFQMVGVPVICSIGVQGQWNHTLREYARLDSMADRGKLLASVVLNLNRF